MDVQHFLNKIPDLTDLDLAVLLSLIAQEHCLITTDDDLVDDLAADLALIVSETFQLSFVVISGPEQESVDQFGEAILNHEPTKEFLGEADATTGMNHDRLAGVSFRAGSYSEQQQSGLDGRMVVNVIIAKDFNLARQDVQIAALELMQRRRIYSRTTVHRVPKVFLFLPIIASSTLDTPLTLHLNTHVFISHHHRAEDGFANLESIEQHNSHRRASVQSSEDDFVDAPSFGQRIDRNIIEKLRTMGKAAKMTPEIRRYIQDIVVFLRLERGVEGGVSASATPMFVALARYLAPLHGIDFVTPSLVMLAARKIYPHRIRIASPKRERSMQYGSDLEAVTLALDGLTPQRVIENVLSTVPCPV